MRTLMTLACLALFVGCGSTSTTTSDSAVPPADMAVTTVADMLMVCCGKPGDVGNDKGVGQYCTSGKDCKTGLVCSNLLGDERMHFCTTPCNPDMGDACGTGAMCVLMAGQPAAGCVPSTCLPPPAGCGM